MKVLPIDANKIGILNICYSCGYTFTQSRYNIEGNISPVCKRPMVYLRPNQIYILRRRTILRINASKL
jgi:hypothetical protein